LDRVDASRDNLRHVMTTTGAVQCDPSPAVGKLLVNDSIQRPRIVS